MLREGRADAPGPAGASPGAAASPGVAVSSTGVSSPASYALLEAALGTPLSPALLERALTHRSYAHEHGGLPTNERLEFLGDAVLGLIVTDALYRADADLPEGQLAKRRASVVNTRALADVARRLDLGQWLRLVAPGLTDRIAARAIEKGR